MERRPNGIILPSNSHHGGGAISAHLTLLGCHRAKFNDLSVAAAARARAHVPDTKASARGGNNGQVYAIRFQPICWRARVM